MHLNNQIYNGANNRQSLIDLRLPENKSSDTILFFVHGYKGFKDWGCWNLVEHYFIEAGIGFCKLNLSHNGGTISDPIDFPDLEAFGENRYTYELEDIAEGIDWLYRQIDMSKMKLYLIGHSRGGGDVMLAGQDDRVEGVITWASIADIGSRFPSGDELKKWRKDGVRFVENTRTKQQMPHNYSFYEDWYYNQDFLSIEKAAKSLNKPCLHVHGDKDEAVSIKESEALSEWTTGKLITISGANHTFGAEHPWKEPLLPALLKEVCLKTLEFITNTN
jgi:uncharacterized protein